MSVDKDDLLPKDMVEQVWLNQIDIHMRKSEMIKCVYMYCVNFSVQLLKYVPTPEEVEALDAHKMELGKFAVSDRFLFEMSQ